jgi:cobalamin biosynthesis protein CobD/CbiB
LGEGAAPVAADIRRALQLVQSGVAVWLVLLCVVGSFYA